MGALFRTRTVVADLIDLAGEAVAAVGLLGLDLLVASRAGRADTRSPTRARRRGVPRPIATDGCVRWEVAERGSQADEPRPLTSKGAASRD